MSKINWHRLHFGMLFLRLGRIHDARLWLGISSITGPFVTKAGPGEGDEGPDAEDTLGGWGGDGICSASHRAATGTSLLG